jgi:hypothetical protein
MKKTALLAVAGLAALVVTAVAFAAPKGMGWSAKLDAMQEIPHQVVKAPNGKGSFNATLTGNTLKWKLTFSGLTGQATAAHIHMGAMGKAGGVVVALCGPCKSGVSGSAKLSKMLETAATKHKLYVNVHTAKNPNGEIRGQVTP